jgi:hypothetical protein
MRKIKISDLSIGDWVNQKMNDGAYQVQWIERETVGLIKHTGTEEDGSIRLTAVPLSFIEPIPLTTDILEKNGLEYEDDGNDAVIFLCCDMFWARLCVGDTFWQVGIHSEDRLDAVVCNVKHTHQLQHALRLAGVGKEIEV